MEVKRYSLEEFKPLAKNAHLICFNEVRDEDVNTYDYALMVEKDGVPQCYCTCIELDKYACYMQHGGTFPSARGTTATHRGYSKMIEWIHERYPRITTKTLNTNIPMLKLAFSVGFVINGMDVFGNEFFVRLINDRKGV